MKQTRPRRLRAHYLTAVCILALYCVSCLLYFITAVDRQIESRMKERVGEVVKMQSDAIRGTMAVQFSTLKSAAHFAAQSMIQSGDIFCPANMQLLDSFRQHSYFSRTMLVNANGYGYLNGGERIASAESTYFASVMKGSDVLTTPLAFTVADAQNDAKSVLLAVPVWKDGQSIGLFGGWYDLDLVSNLLFSDVYNGLAISYIATSDGQIICSSGNVTENPSGSLFDLFAPHGDSPTRDSLRSDFLSGRSGIFECTHGGSHHTVAYHPLNIGSWMLVYTVPETYVGIQYDFIKLYEAMLFIAILFGCGLFLVYALTIMYSDRVRLSHQAKTDALSGLLNRAAAEESIENLLRLSGQVNGVMLLLDLDHFKEVNDSHGHQMGDKLIAQVGQMLLSTFRATDYCCRLGGDEFLIFMRGSLSHEIVCERAQMLCDTLPQLLKEELYDVHWSLSIGIAYAPKDGKTFGELYRNSDKALYAAKSKGRACYCFYEAE